MLYIEYHKLSGFIITKDYSWIKDLFYVNGDSMGGEDILEPDKKKPLMK